jgi:hypothetical protein
MKAVEIVRELQHYGGHTTVVGGDLVLTAPQPLPPELLHELRTHSPRCWRT